MITDWFMRILISAGLWMWGSILWLPVTSLIPAWSLRRLVQYYMFKLTYWAECCDSRKLQHHHPVQPLRYSYIRSLFKSNTSRDVSRRNALTVDNSVMQIGERLAGSGSLNTATDEAIVAEATWCECLTGLSMIGCHCGEPLGRDFTSCGL